jgi:hypothetical protein
MLPGDSNAHGEDTVQFFRELRRHRPGPMVVRWGRSNIHDRSKAVRAYLAEHPAIETEPFPELRGRVEPRRRGVAARQARAAGGLRGRGHSRVAGGAGPGARACYEL